MEETNRIELVEEPQKAIPQEENQPEEAFPVQEGSQTTQAGDPFEAVSYTHLTLPTIYSV